MNTIDIARKLAALREVADAQRAYALFLQQTDASEPICELEAATYLFENGGDYRVSYTTFQSLYNRGHFQDELFNLMVGAFYAPNLKPQQNLYQRNCKLLERYPYLFRKDFLPFDELPIKFFPFDDNGVSPFDTQTNQFGGYVNVHDTIISKNFFADLENPILAEDVYSQYELEYLNDNVRRSEWVGRENHIYLHYTSWTTFCSYLQCIDFRELLKSEKLVFLMEEEAGLYPLDFKERFGIDYSQFPVRPVAVREVNRLIWHTQLATHNGGDFFNEIFYGHPNLLSDQSIMFDSVVECVAGIKKAAQQKLRPGEILEIKEGIKTLDQKVFRNLIKLRDLTDKDIFVALFLSDLNNNKARDLNARIAPAVLFQPHFPNMIYSLRTDEKNMAVLNSQQYDEIRKSPIFQGFKYIKTFTPLRRITTSYGATVKFMIYNQTPGNEHESTVLGDAISERLLNRSFMIDWKDRLYRDSVLVRFEDGKLNPKATFTALAAFLDLPYTHSMTYCSGVSGVDPESLAGNALGFDPSRIYRTYDEYANDAERYFLEYFLRDAYEYYGYDLHYYDGKPMDEERVRELIAGFTTLNRYVGESWDAALRNSPLVTMSASARAQLEGPFDQVVETLVDRQIEGQTGRRLEIAKILMRGLNFINREGQPLRMMPRLQLDPELLEHPLYH